MLYIRFHWPYIKDIIYKVARLYTKMNTRALFLVSGRGLCFLPDILSMIVLMDSSWPVYKVLTKTFGIGFSVLNESSSGSVSLKDECSIT